MILITGAAQGLGADIARELASKGHSLLLHYRKSEKKAGEVATNCRSHGVEVNLIQGDFSTQESTDDFVKQLKNYSVKGVVNNVGEYFLGSLEETSSTRWRHFYESNVHAPFAIVSSLLPSLKKHRGCVVNIGCAGLHALRASVDMPLYLMTKHSLALLTTSFAKELAPVGVTVNMVSPGYLESSIDMPTHFPMGRAATTDEVARVVAFFFAEENAYITGQNIEVAGGIAL